MMTVLGGRIEVPSKTLTFLRAIFFHVEFLGGCAAGAARTWTCSMPCSPIHAFARFKEVARRHTEKTCRSEGILSGAEWKVLKIG